MPSNETTAVSSVPAVLNSWAEHCDSIDTRLNDLDGLLRQLYVAMSGPHPEEGCDKGAQPDGPPNFNELVRKSIKLRTRFEETLKQLHAILD